MRRLVVAGKITGIIIYLNPAVALFLNPLQSCQVSHDSRERQSPVVTSRRLRYRDSAVTWGPWWAIKLVTSLPLCDLRSDSSVFLRVYTPTRRFFRLLAQNILFATPSPS